MEKSQITINIESCQRSDNKSKKNSKLKMDFFKLMISCHLLKNIGRMGKVAIFHEILGFSRIFFFFKTVFGT